MRPSESAPARKADLREVRELLETVGQALGYAISERRSALVWEQEDVEPWFFYPMASSIISRYLLPASETGQHVLVLPGSRARLVSYKLHRDPRLEEAIQAGSRWRFLKFRHLRDIAARADLPTLNWEALLDEDPLTEEATQMQLFANT